MKPSNCVFIATSLDGYIADKDGGIDWLPMRTFLFFVCLVMFQTGSAQVLLEADGPGNTYELITSVLAPNNNPIETPDCSHEDFGDHIDEVFDDQLAQNVFRFHIHVSPDNDRCINFDRQRNEIKSYDKSPENLLGTAGETVVYSWKFKLAEGFQSSPNFTHLHQLKSVGGSLASMPMYTLTARKGSPDRIELRYAETDDQITLSQTDLAPLIGNWLEVTETVLYGTSGTYAIAIKKVDDGTILFSYENDNIINWRSGAEFVRPKWGIYRSLINSQDLRDEAVLFGSFSIEEPTILSLDKSENGRVSLFPNPAEGILYIKDPSSQVEAIDIYSLDGRKLFTTGTKKFGTFQEVDVSTFSNGTYVVQLKGEIFLKPELLIIAR